MKRILKSRIFQLIITAIIFTGIGTFASNILAGEIDYEPQDPNWEAETVEEALNDLYIKKIDLSLVDKSGIAGNTITNRTTSFNLEPGNYLVILSEYSAMCAGCSTPSISVSTTNNATITEFTDHINAYSNTYSAKNYMKLYKISALENSTINVISNDGTTRNDVTSGLSYIIVKVKQ